MLFMCCKLAGLEMNFDQTNIDDIRSIITCCLMARRKVKTELRTGDSSGLHGSLRMLAGEEPTQEDRESWSHEEVVEWRMSDI